jgi:hypothetical protein
MLSCALHTDGEAGLGEAAAMMILLCPTCHHEIKASVGDWRLPPWCPKCGSAVQAGPETVQFQSLLDRVGEKPSLPLGDATAAGPARPGTASDATNQPVTIPQETPTFFCGMQPTIWGARKRMHYRFYPMSRDLIIVRSGGGTTDRDHVAAVGMAVGGPLWGPTVADHWTVDMPRSRLLTRTEWLQAADEAQLRMYVNDADGGYIIDPDEVSWLRIDPPSLWRRALGSLPHEAMLRFEHGQYGVLKFALPTFSDARRATQWLPRLFDHQCRINLPWSK